MRPLLPALLALATASCVRTQADMERDYARNFKPAHLEAAPAAAPKPVRVFRVKALADADYRAQVLRWDAQIRRLFEDASAITGPRFGVRFEVAEVVPWDHAGTGPDLAPVLDEIAKAEPKPATEWVVGFVASLSVFSSTQHHLGHAEIFGRYAVLRGVENVAEAEAFLEGFSHLPLAEREELIAERLAHKRVALLLHEWAHAVGGLHDRSDETLLSPVYDPRQSTFSPLSTRLIEIGLAHHAHADAPEELKSWAREARDVLLPADDTEVRPEDRQQALKRLDAILAAKAPPKAPPWTEEERLRYNRAVALAVEGKVAEASAELAPLLTPTTTRAPVLELGCDLAMQRRGLGAHDLETCERAARLPEASGLMALRVAHLQIFAGNLVAAIERLEKPVADTRGSANSAEILDYRARLLQQAWCVTWAEDAAEGLAEERAAEVRAWARRMRQEYGLPRGEHPAIAPAAESAYVVKARAVQKDAASGHVKEALAGAEELARTYANAPGTQAILCEVNLRAGRMEPAKKACEKALAGDDDLVLVHAWLGSLAKSPAEAEKHLWRVIALDPTREEEARGTYRARFHRDLPVPPPSAKR